MRTPIPSGRRPDPLPRGERGSAMLAALCFAIVFTICLASFIAVTYSSARLSTRNLMRAHASEVAEAGLELALYAINNESTTWPGWTTSPAASGTATAILTMAWDPSSHIPLGLVLTSSSPTAMDFGNGVNAQVAVTITGTGTTSPVFTSSATVTIPNEVPVYRKLTATGAPAPIFVNALSATTGNISFASGGVVDSYNSTLAPYSTPGYTAVVASGNNAAGTTITLANANIYGFATGFDSASPTTTNWLSYSGGGKVIGASSGSVFIDSSRLITNPNPYQPQFSDVPEPPTGTVTFLGSVALAGTATLTLGNVLGLPAVYDVAGDVNIGGLAQLTVLGPVILYVHGNFNLNPLGSDLGILLFTNPLGTTHPSLEVHIVGTSGNVTINGGTILGNFPLYLSPILNIAPGSPPRPQWLTIVGPNDSGGVVTIGNASPLYATIYFPRAPVTVTGNATIFGSIVGSYINLTGSPAIHYDTALRTPTSFVYDAAFHAFQAPFVLGAVTDSAGP